MNLVTVEEARDNLLIDFVSPEIDRDLRLKIAAASSAVINYLRRRSAVYQLETDENGVVESDSNGDPVYALDSQGDRIIRAEVKQATLVLVGILFRDRDGAESKEWREGYLPFPVTALLYPLRSPALA